MFFHVGLEELCLLDEIEFFSMMDLQQIMLWYIDVDICRH